MDRSEIHHGQILLLKELKNTERLFGGEADLNKLIGTYIRVQFFDEYHPAAIIIEYGGYNYSIHVGDLIDPLTIEEDSERRIIKVKSEINVTFDENELFL